MLISATDHYSEKEPEATGYEPQTMVKRGLGFMI
jgi:hypothetical protein